MMDIDYTSKIEKLEDKLDEMSTRLKVTNNALLVIAEFVHSLEVLFLDAHSENLNVRYSNKTVGDDQRMLQVLHDIIEQNGKKGEKNAN